MILATKPKQPHHVDGVWNGGVVSHNGPWCRSRQAMERWLGPVSYTHLTLPTIYSV